MSIKTCWGTEVKKNIVDEYSLEPIIYVKLLDGQDRHGCCGIVKDKYYFFEATHKKTNKIENFIVGYNCAEQLLKLSGKEKLKLFNPLQAQEHNYGTGNNVGSKNTIKVSSINKELSNAIHLLCCAWGKVPYGPLKRNLDYIRNMPERATNDFTIFDFNDIVGDDYLGRSLENIIDDLRIKNPKLRNFTFGNMQKVLLDNSVVSNL